MSVESSRQTVEEARIFEFFYAYGAQPGPMGECAEDGCEVEAWVAVRGAPRRYICVNHYQARFEEAVRADARRDLETALRTAQAMLAAAASALDEAYPDERPEDRVMQQDLRRFAGTFRLDMLSDEGRRYVDEFEAKVGDALSAVRAAVGESSVEGSGR